MITCLHCASLIFASTPFLEKTAEPTNTEDAAFVTPDANECNADLCKGMLFLMEQNPSASLDALELATLRSQDNLLQNDTTFIIAFCKVIAYDQLGSKDLSMNILDWLNNSLSDETSPCEEQEVGTASRDSQEAVEFLNRLAALAPSADIKQALLQIVGQMSGEIPPVYYLDSSACLTDTENASSNRGGFSKFIKKWKHILKRVGQLCELIKNIEQIITDSKTLIKD